jgi:hypothetical protein
MFYLKPPRHISTLPKTEVAALRRDVCFALDERTSSGCPGMSEKCAGNRRSKLAGIDVLNVVLLLRLFSSPQRSARVECFRVQLNR